MRAYDLLENSLIELLDLDMNESDLETLDEIIKLLYLYQNTAEDKKSKVYSDLLDLETSF